MGALWQDLRYGVRMLAAKPGFTAIAVAVLALGTGATTGIFSLVNAFLLKPLLIRQPEQIVGVFSRDIRHPDSYRAFSYPNYLDVREKNPTLSSVLAHNLSMVGLAEGDITRRVFADTVSSNYFATLGVPLKQGRTFTDAEERPASGVAVTIVSYSFWKRLGDPNLLGRTLRVNGRVFTVVGVAAEGFTGTTAMISPELYFPLGVYEWILNDFDGGGRLLAARDNHSLILVGRLRPGVTQGMADAQLEAMAAAMGRAHPAENRDQSMLVRPLSRLSVSTAPQSDKQLGVLAGLLLAMSSVVLLIASLNVANMMLAHGSARRKEIAIRLALGGGRASIVRQLFTEGLVLALAGGAAGLVLSYWSTTLLVRSLAVLAPLDMVYAAGPDLRVLAATLVCCTFSTVLFALMPAWNLSRPDVLSDLKGGSQGVFAKGAPGSVFSRRNLLVMGQISLSLMLLTAAGLFLRSFTRAAQVDPGFRMENSLLVETDPNLAGYAEPQGRQVYRGLLDRLAALPGVQSAAIAATVPFGMVSLGRSVQPAKDAQAVGCSFNIVSERYFETLGIPLLRGRAFLPAEAGAGTRPVVILDQAAAHRLWPDGEAVGRHLRMVTDEAAHKSKDVEVVGVVGSITRHIIGHGEEPQLYVPFGQEYHSNMSIHLKVAAQGAEGEKRMLEVVRREVRAFDARLPVLTLRSLREYLDRSLELWIVRTGSSMFSVFGGVALLLAMIGLYGIRAYTVARRTREIGIRMALGATSGDTLELILREGAKIAGVGVAVGLVFSWALGRLLASMLSRVSGTDAVVFLTAPVLLTAVSLLACYIPARKAARVDPMVALRYE